MPIKKAQFNIKGMTRDLAASKFSPEFAYENMNLRLIATDDNDTLTLVNEKGNVAKTISWDRMYSSGTPQLPPLAEGSYVMGTPIGQQVLGDSLILFTAGDDEPVVTIPDETYEAEELPSPSSTATTITTEYDDNIYKFWFSSGILRGRKLFQGDLNFDKFKPIESIGVYENESLQKVYWVDGVNQPRVINIASDANRIKSWKGNSFNFVTDIKPTGRSDIERNLVTNGYFAPGTIQYAFTYFNLYGQESNIFTTSPLYYVSYNNRGASPDDTVANSFTIKLSYLDTSFDFVRIYSIHRTSLNGTPNVRKVVDLQIPKYEYPAWVSGNTYRVNDRVSYEGIAYRCTTANTADYFTTAYFTREYMLTYTDTGSSGATIDPTQLLYVGGEATTASTLVQKDNTLFLGDIGYNKLVVSSAELTGAPTFTTEYPGNKVLGGFGGFYTYNSQLLYNSQQIKGFKYQEYYRFGLQFQHKTGRWSSPVWIGDAKNTSITPSMGIFNDGYSTPVEYVNHPIASKVIDDSTTIANLVSQGYVKVRPVVVYPSIEDREVVCQGVVCPTVYNVEDRFGNSPYVQSSWFFRPDAPCEIDQTDPESSDDPNLDAWLDYDTGESYTKESKGGAVALDTTTLASGGGTELKADVVNRGAWLEFRNNRPIPDNSKRNAEIQCITNPPTTPARTPGANDNVNTFLTTWVSRNKEVFYVDRSIVTLHSPDIEFNTQVRSLDNSNLKFRIVGLIPITAFNSGVEIETSTPPMDRLDDKGVWQGKYYEPVNVENASTFGWKALVSAPMWLDGCHKLGTFASFAAKKWGWLYVIYPWQRSGSLNNTQSVEGEETMTSVLSHKVLSNSRFSYNTLYLPESNFWPLTAQSRDVATAGVQIFDSNEVTPLKLPAQYTGLPEGIYYGNIDRVITFPTTTGDTEKDKGYPIMIAGYLEDESNMHNVYRSDYQIVSKGYAKDDVSGSWIEKTTLTTEDHSTSPISMRYKSTPHAVVVFKNWVSGVNNRQRTLPSFVDVGLGNIEEGGTNIPINGNFTYARSRFFWDSSRITTGVNQDTVVLPCDGQETGATGWNTYYKTRFGYMWLGELYNDSTTTATRFGGKTQEALENNKWQIGGAAISLLTDSGTPKSSVTVRWTEGDTYYQRYDCLKTYPFSNEDPNSIIEVLSFMVETRVNVDGRYDRNRGQTNNFFMSPANFNLLNPAYSQENNFFNYQYVNTNKLLVNYFPNAITWTKTKTAGEEIDTWTNINLTSILEMDGDRGTVRALRRFNDNLIAFQDEAISQILYNENVQIASTTGVPIEIANSGKVSGKRYITNHIGCTNKWSICSTPNGLYFIDNRTKDIYLFNGQINNLSDKLGFHSWMVNNFENVKIWDPVGFHGGVVYYDRINQDVFFITRDSCLAFNENLNNFSSFYSYENTPYFSNLEDKGIAWHLSNADSLETKHYKPWMHREGEYNKFFDVYQPYWTTVVVNPDVTMDKVFNNVEFRADSFDSNGVLISNHTFDHLNTWNEYQSGTVELTNIKDLPSPLKKKFRIWHAQIPRWNVNVNGQTANRRDRMRNPWLYLKLSTENENNINTNYKSVLHDLVVDYFE